MTIMNAVAFKRDLLEMQSDLQRFAFKLTADKEDANDLLQETSLRALENMEKYTPDTNFKGWVYTIMRNIFINNYRKVLREQTFVDYTEKLFKNYSIILLSINLQHASCTIASAVSALNS